MRFASLFDVTTTGRAIKSDLPRSMQEAFLARAYRIASLYEVTSTGRAIKGKALAGFQGPGGGMFMGPGGMPNAVRGGGAGNIINAFQRRDCQVPFNIQGMGPVDTGQPSGMRNNQAAFRAGLHIGAGNRPSLGGGGGQQQQGGNQRGMGRGPGMFMGGPGGGMMGPFGNMGGPNFGDSEGFLARAYQGGPFDGPFGPGGPGGPGPGGPFGGPGGPGGPGGNFSGPGGPNGPGGNFTGGPGGPGGGMFQGRGMMGPGGPGGMFMGPMGPGGGMMGGGSVQQTLNAARGTNCGGGVRQLDVMIMSKQGQYQTIRGLIDSGAGVTLMDPQVGQMLGFGRQDAVRTIQAQGEQASSNNVPLINIMMIIPPDDKPLAAQAALFADMQDGVFTPIPTCDLTMRVNIDIDQQGHTITSQSNGMSMRYDCMGGGMGGMNNRGGMMGMGGRMQRGMGRMMM